MPTATVLMIGADNRQVPDVGDRAPDVGRFDLWDREAHEWFAAQLCHALVGWRCIVVGPHVAVSAAQAMAREAGAVAEEITVVVIEGPGRRVYCAGCGTSSIGSGPRVGCSGCGADLTVGEHFSPRLAAFLGSP